MRRMILEEPLAKTAAWSRAFAIFSFVVAVVGVVLARGGLDPSAAVAVESGAVLIALAAVLSAAAAAVVIWRTGYRGTGRLLAGSAIACLVLAYPAYVLVEARGRASLGDASTDLETPPTFSRLAQAIATRGGLTPGATSPDADLQRRLYPDLQPLLVDLEPLDAFRLVTKIVAARRWRVVEQSLPLGRLGTGRIEAVAGSTLMGFPADVAIRIKPTSGQTRIDIRSVSRTRWHAPDSDPRRVEALAADIEEQTDQ